jgi:hypothetical protein
MRKLITFIYVINLIVNISLITSALKGHRYQEAMAWFCASAWFINYWAKDRAE